MQLWKFILTVILQSKRKLMLDKRKTKNAWCRGDKRMQSGGFIGIERNVIDASRKAWVCRRYLGFYHNLERARLQSVVVETVLALCSPSPAILSQIPHHQTHTSALLWRGAQRPRSGCRLRRRACPASCQS